MSARKKEHRDRLVILTFVSVLLVLIYGPAAPWFIAADRFLFDQFASHVRGAPLANAMIISINPAKKTNDDILGDYGKLVEVIQNQNVGRLILAEPPLIGEAGQLPGWAALLEGDTPVFVPAGHRFADVADRTGILALNPDSDEILRQVRLWHLQGDIMSPTLPLAIALAGENFISDPRVSHADFSIYLTNYEPVERISSEDVLDAEFDTTVFKGKTIFLDASPTLVRASAVLPSGQFATTSEVTAQLLADIEQGHTVVAPTWLRALEWLVPGLLAIIASLFLPSRNRRDIFLFATITILLVILVEGLFLLIGRMRLDLGRAVVIFLGASTLGWWLAGTVKKASANAFKRGNDFLAAGRLEPAFAEFRRCEANEPLASAMYKLSLAFEEQAKPERAEAVIQWMKRTQGSTHAPNKFSLGGKHGSPQRLGRYVIERKLGRGAMGAVYLARDPRINRAVALKVIPIEKEFEDEELEEARLRFFREAESAGRLTHPNIVTVYDCGEDKHLAYIAMEYLQGTPLTQFTDPKRLLAPNKALELCARVADALDYAHNQGVIHRDIKPANLLYSMRQDLLKISDFGVARLTDNNRTKTGI